MLPGSGDHIDECILGINQVTRVSRSALIAISALSHGISIIRFASKNNLQIDSSDKLSFWAKYPQIDPMYDSGNFHKDTTTFCPAIPEFHLQAIRP
jgi:hypothetical protein